MIKKFFVLSFLILFGVAAVSASNLDGKWKGSVPSPDGGSLELTYLFKVDGEKLTGSVTSEMGEILISSGKVTGDEFEYSLDINGMVIKDKGKLVGEEIKIKSTSEWGENEITLKRVKE
jgi:hypothetical protein